VELDDLAEALERVKELDPSVLADPESIVSLHRIQAGMDAVVTQATARPSMRPAAGRPAGPGVPRSG
jgi:hypothetical protein